MINILLLIERHNEVFLWKSLGWIFEKEQGNLGFQLLPKKKLKVSCTRKIDAGSCRKMSEPFPATRAPRSSKKPELI
jgi:hypothetical protein